MPRQDGSTARRAALTGMTMVTVGSMTANVAAYLLHLVAGRFLQPDGYGEFASLLTAQLVIAVPALALQTVVAREVARGADPAGARRLGYRCTVIAALLAAAATPLCAAVLGTGEWTAAAALVAAPLLVLLGAEQGLLQGQGRFGPLSAVLAGAGLARVIPGVAVLWAGGGPAAALLAGAVGTAVAAGAAHLMARTGLQSGLRIDPAGRTAGVVAVLLASQVQLVLVVLTSLDLIVARAVLDEDHAGLYAMGAIATKAAFWLPQAVGVVLYPRMANPDHSARAVRTALLVLAGVGVLAVLAAAVAAPLVPLLVGDAYRPVTGLLWLFALEGAILALLQGALLSTIARERTGFAGVAWVGVAVEAVVLPLAGSVTALLVSAVACAAVTTAVVTALVLRSVADAPATGRTSRTRRARRPRAPSR
ncbi:polysaccharide biosynthesis protein [Rhodococcus sp. D2-41]|uniref:Polysaccharide biosynthesis protein n=1 Tax=Speluncibacter jeojiensis TaxID=2710754 RepID=A0A9X4M430_9ACTN|nr:polysaccharide biosynthesis protein [Rhodococcus sp. D2-41]MDG3010279.1 polysaccharide biosynthesis protein [Rhodococcus sp. D2-41]MDG3015792.1 polysaccharide biosynthesis protein [Corynebacteriales bacterium D3-21]